VASPTGPDGTELHHQAYIPQAGAGKSHPTVDFTTGPVDRRKLLFTKGWFAALRPIELAVWWAYECFSDRDGYAWPDRDKIANGLGHADDSHVRVAINSLIAYALLRRSPTEECPDLVQLLVPGAAPSAQKSRRIGAESSGATAPNRPKNCADSAQKSRRIGAVHNKDEEAIEEAKEDVRPPNPRSAGDGVSRSASTKFFGFASSLKSDTPPTRPLPALESAEMPGFVRFWEAYPRSCRKVAECQCRRAWRRKGLEAVAEQVIAGVERWKASRGWTKEAGQFIPAPLVFLNQARWEAPPETFNEGNGHGTHNGHCGIVENLTL
jgi:hypothetical protein